MRLAIRDVHPDPAIQLRDGLDMDRVRAMQEFEEQGGHLPPITVVGDDNILADGHHRLEVADSMGRVDIDAERVPGDRTEAVALAIQLNDIATSKPLTRDQRNKGIKLLLAAGWTQEQIATRTGVHDTTISNIGNSLAMRGQITKKVGGRGTPKRVATLPPEVADKLNDTVLVRIADSKMPVEKQAEFAAAVAAVPNKKNPNKTGLSEPRVREALKKVADGVPITEAVEEMTPGGGEMPVTMSDVAQQAYQRLDRFLTATMVIEGTKRDFWQVLEVLVTHQSDLLDPTVNTLADKLAELAARSDQYATLLKSRRALKKVSA